MPLDPDRQIDIPIHDILSRITRLNKINTGLLLNIHLAKQFNLWCCRILHRDTASFGSCPVSAVITYIVHEFIKTRYYDIHIPGRNNLTGQITVQHILRLGTRINKCLSRFYHYVRLA